MLIKNAAQQSLNAINGTMPDVSGALTDWFQPMTFTRVKKKTSAFQVIETPIPINFQGVIQPLQPRRLELKPEGQRSWTWFLLHAEPTLKLNTDEVVVYKGVQTRIMSRKDYSLNGYVEYEIVQDWTGAGPNI